MSVRTRGSALGSETYTMDCQSLLGLVSNGPLGTIIYQMKDSEGLRLLNSFIVTACKQLSYHRSMHSFVQSRTASLRKPELH